MYEQYFGLNERPFDLTPNPRYLFLTDKHREALSHLEYGISGRKGITVLTGEAGTGKTTLVHTALAHQREENARTVYLSNPLLSRAEFFEFPPFLLNLRVHLLNLRVQFCLLCLRFRLLAFKVV